MASSLLTGLVPASAAQRAAVMGNVSFSFSSRTAFCGSRLHNLKLVGNNNVSRSGKGRGNALGCRAALAVGRGERRGSGEDWMFDPLELGNNDKDASLPNFWGAIESSVLQQSRSGSGRSSGSSSSKGAAGAYNWFDGVQFHCAHWSEFHIASGD